MRCAAQHGISKEGALHSLCHVTLASFKAEVQHASKLDVIVKMIYFGCLNRNQEHRDETGEK